MARTETVNFAQTIISGPSSGNPILVGSAITSDDFPESNFYGTIQQVVDGEIVKKEVVFCSTRVGTTFNVSRGYDGTPAQDFTTGGGVVYLVIATVSGHIQDLRDDIEEISAVSTTAKTTPVNADLFTLRNSAASFAREYVSWSNIKATLEAYFDMMYLGITDLRIGLSNWKMYHTNGSGAETEITLGASGTVLTSNGASAAPTFQSLPTSLTRVIKTSNEQKTSNTTLANDSALTFAMLANTKYMFRAVIHINIYAAGDFKYRHVGPASPTLVSIHRRSVVPAATAFSSQLVDEAYSAADVTILLGSSNGQGVILMEGIIHNGANAGSFAFQWAQNTSDGNPTTVYAGSFLEYTSL